MKKIIAMFIGTLVLTGCQAPLATIPARQVETAKITLGGVQSKVKEGATSSEVVEVLGSPNIVTSNPDNSETWVYDKVMTESEVATGWNSAVTTRSTRTFLVVVRFGLDKRVKAVSYRQTSY